MVLIFVKTAGKPMVLNVKAGDMLDLKNLIDIGLPTKVVLEKHSKDELNNIMSTGCGWSLGTAMSKNKMIDETLKVWQRLDSYNSRNDKATSSKGKDDWGVEGVDWFYTDDKKDTTNFIIFEGALKGHWHRHKPIYYTILYITQVWHTDTCMKHTYFFV